MTQKDRILSALRFEGTRGITAVDFSSPHVYDGDKPIMRVAARVHELREEGHDIVTQGERQGCDVYVLRAAPRVVVDSQGPPADSLFDAAPARPSQYFGEAA
jgi:hypothetical protein